MRQYLIGWADGHYRKAAPDNRYVQEVSGQGEELLKSVFKAKYRFPTLKKITPEIFLEKKAIEKTLATYSNAIEITGRRELKIFSMPVFEIPDLPPDFITIKTYDDRQGRFV